MNAIKVPKKLNEWINLQIITSSNFLHFTEYTLSSNFQLDSRRSIDMSVDLKQIDCQLFLQQKKNGFIWDQQRIAIWSLQPW